jgi:septal ring factor EnvC (AmiA/AmiB activator)
MNKEQWKDEAQNQEGLKDYWFRCYELMQDGKNDAVRQSLELVRQIHQFVKTVEGMSAKNDKLHDRIKGLEGTVSRWKAAHDRAHAIVVEQEAEIEKLEAEINRLKDERLTGKPEPVSED